MQLRLDSAQPFERIFPVTPTPEVSPIVGQKRPSLDRDGLSKMAAVRPASVPDLARVPSPHQLP